MAQVKVLTIPLEKQMFAAVRRGDLVEFKRIYYTLYPNDPGGDEYSEEIAGRGESAEQEQNKAGESSSGDGIPAPPLSKERPAMQDNHMQSDLKSETIRRDG